MCSSDLVAVPLGILWAVVAALDHRRDLAQRIDDQRALLGRFEAMAARPIATTSQLDPALFVAGDSEAQRSARLQALVSDRAQQLGLRVESLRPLPDKESGSLRLIGVRMQLLIGIEEAARLIHALEGGTPAILLQGWQISPRSTFGAQGDGTAQIGRAHV